MVVPFMSLRYTDILEHSTLLIFNSLVPKGKYFSLKSDVLNHYGANLAISI